MVEEPEGTPRSRGGAKEGAGARGVGAGWSVDAGGEEEGEAAKEVRRATASEGGVGGTGVELGKEGRAESSCGNCLW